mmetsp:Transcript_14165/g.37407  ORF Transcript_14165/g.37407 Transcript_14165/m.37407 type:complete len:93 (+) Transcript_14165:295-573(+)
MELRHAAELAETRKMCNSTLERAELTQKAKRATELALEQAEFDALPPVIRNLMTAHKLGKLESHAECLEILTDISKVLGLINSSRACCSGPT